MTLKHMHDQNNLLVLPLVNLTNYEGAHAGADPKEKREVEIICVQYPKER